MWNRRLCFLLLLGEGVYLGMLYNYQGIRLMLCFLIFLPLVCLLLLLLSWPACRVVLRTGQDVITRGEQVEVRVAVENRGLFPVSRVLVCPVEGSRPEGSQDEAVDLRSGTGLQGGSCLCPVPAALRSGPISGVQGSGLRLSGTVLSARESFFGGKIF